MCYASGSIEQVTRTCVMCKVYPPKLGCPHQPLGVCRNRQNHPRFDVVHFKNAELSLFNGCGYCKWAKQHSASTNEKGWFNTGWPGCCRPPKGYESCYINGPVEWQAISVVHGISIPVDTLEALRPLRANGSFKKSSQVNGKTSPTSPTQSLDKEPPTSRASSSSPPRTPVQEAPATPESVPPFAYRSTPRRKAFKSGDTHIRPLASRPSVMAHCQSPSCTFEAASAQDAKDTSHVDGNGPHSIPGSFRHNPSVAHIVASPPSPPSTKSISVHSNMSTIDSITVTSEGFTDYLSDESEKELQRQAENKAAELVIAQQEKAEFDAALHTVRDICLQPPPEWHPRLTATISRSRTPSSFPNFRNPSVIPIAIGHSRH